MKYFFQKHAIILAALLQVLPIVRNLVTSPAANSTFAIILRWTVGSTAAVGAFDSVSGASIPTHFIPFQTNIVLTVGTFYTNSIVVTNTGTDSGAYIELTNSARLDSGQIGNGATTTVCLPTGLTLKVFDFPSKVYLYGAIYGTPTTVSNITRVSVDAGLSGKGDIFTNIFFTVLAASSPPIITNNPVSVTNIVGNNVTFSVTNGGTAPFTYQWYFNTNTALPGATNSSLTLTNIQLTNTGYYLVAITNSVGSTNSLNALLTVWQPPVITNQPVNFTNVAGGNAGFNVVAGGTPALNYQWQFNTNTALFSATNSSLNLTNIRASQAGTYTVVLTNSAGSLTSSPALLVVTTPTSPQITAPTIAGGVFQFTFNPVVGLTNSVLTNDNVSGGSWVVMTNVPPPATTNAVTVSDTISGTNRFYRVQIIP